MPAPTSPETLSAIIGFTLPASRLDHDEAIYLTYDPAVTRPTEKIRVPLVDLRPELEAAGAGVSATVASQLAERGFAVMKHESTLLDEIPSEEGTGRYLDECCEVLKTQLDCDRVIAWNSVCRRNEPEVKLKHVERQQGPEKGFVPTSRLQPIAGVAHIDQDRVWGKELCGKAIGQPVDDFKRCAIINIWRPLLGPVSNAPLAMLPYSSLSAHPETIATHGHLFGTGHDLHHHPSQEWSYIRHQMPGEIIFLKCYDSFSTGDTERDKPESSSEGGENAIPARFCGHVAVDVGEQDGFSELGGGRGRESVEVRLVAVWE